MLYIQYFFILTKSLNTSMVSIGIPMFWFFMSKKEKSLSRNLNRTDMVC